MLKSYTVLLFIGTLWYTLVSLHESIEKRIFQVISDKETPNTKAFHEPQEDHKLLELELLPPPGMETIPAGSYIVNMSVEPQTINNALKPYGFVYELINTYKIPIKWAINPGKAKDGIDFSYDGVDYKAGPFIITAEYRTLEIDAVIAAWETQGMIGVTTTSEITVPIFETITYTMKWTLDQQNGGIAENYLNIAGIPSSSFNWKTLDNLECCNDVFVMPHAHPDWETHKYLLGWNDTRESGGCAGAIWAGCRAASNLENLYNPIDPSVVSNFLMIDANPPTTYPAIWHGDHDDGSIPPAYQYDHHDHPIMQFLGLIDGATEGGSEQIYLPYNGWRPTTLVGIWDDSHADVPSLSPGKAAKLVFGPGFGDPDRGYVVYEGGHKLGDGSSPESVAAIRAFFNFSFMAIQRKAIKVTVSIPSVMETGRDYPVRATATGGSGEYVFEWETDCTGTFLNPFSSSTTFTPSGGSPPGGCFMKVYVTDECATRVGFGNINITIVPTPAPPIAVDDSDNTQPGIPVTVDAVANDSDPNLDPITLSLIGSGITPNGTFIDNGDGTVTYTSDPTYIGLDSVDYQICDTTAMCDTATIVIDINITDANGCFPTETYRTIYTGYGNSQTNNTNVGNPDDAIGIPDGNTATVERHSDPARQGELTIDLEDLVPQNDTIWLHVGAQDGNPSDFVVSISDDGVSFTGAQTFTAPDATIVPYTYVVGAAGGARYVRIEKQDGIKDVEVDAVRYNRKECVTDCTASEYAVSRSGNADNYDVSSTSANPDRALGTPDQDGSEVDGGSGEFLILDLSDTLSTGAYALLYLAHDGSNASFSVSGSLDNVSYTDVQNYTIVVENSNFAQVQYQVNQASGIRYLRITETNGVKAFVDAIEYDFIGCLSAEPIAVDDAVSTFEDTPVNYPVQINDSDPQNLPLTTSILSGPSNGFGVVEVDGTITYYPATDFTGLDTINYQVCNTDGVCASAIHVITVVSDGCPPNFVPSSNADSLSLNPSQDNWITGQNNTDNNGTCNSLQVDKEASQPDHSLLKFDLSGIPAGAIITEASLVLSKTGGSVGGYEVSIHQLTADWDEGTQCTSTGISNWDDRQSGIPWTTPGGDYNPVAEQTISVGADGVYSWNVRDLVQSWVDGTSNFGFLLKATVEVGGNDALIFASNENGVVADRPLLDIKYDENVGPCVSNSPAPIANDDYDSTTENTPVAVDVLSNDSGGNSPLDTSSVTTTGLLSPTNGAVSFIDPVTGAITYLPDAGFLGLDSFQYSVCNLDALCDTAMVYVQVNCSPPVIGACTGTYRDTFLNIAYNGSDGTEDWSANLWDEIGDGADDNSTGAIAVRNSGYSFGGWGNTLKTHLGHANSAPGVYVYREIDLSSATSATLSFYLRHDLSGTDTIALEISDDGGASWNVLKNFTATNPDPNNESFDISAYLAANTQIRFILVNIGGGGAIWTDNIEIALNCGANPNDNFITGTVFNDLDLDTLFNNGDYGRDSVRVFLYHDVNQNVQLDLGDVQIDSTWTDSSGAYSFLLAPPTVTISSQISSSADDAEEGGSDGSRSGVVQLNSTDIELVVDDWTGVSPEIGPQTQHVGLRFNNMNIPQGAIITDAYIEFIATLPDAPNTNTGATSLTLNGQDIDNAPVFTTAANSISTRATTTASVSWNPPSWTTNDTFPSPDLSTIVQEIVDRPGWISNNSIVFIITGSGSRSAYNYDSSPGQAPLIYIEYLVPRSYITTLDTTNFPYLTTLTTDNIETALFTASGQTDCYNNFGLIVNLPPVAVNDTTTTEETVPVDIIVIANDSDPDSTTLTVTLLAPPSDGNVTNNNDGSVTYVTTTPGFTGQDSFTYYICDAGFPVLCDTATVIVNVLPFINSPPIAVDDYDTISVNQDIAIDVLDNDSDPENDPLTVSLSPGILQPSNGSIVLFANQKIEYIPDPFYVGDDAFEYIICDDRIPALCDTATVFIHVINRPPIAIDDFESTFIDTPLVIDVMNNDLDPDFHDIGLVSAGTDAADGASTKGGTAVINNNGTPADPTDDYIDYTPPLGYFGLDTFLYIINDIAIPSYSDTAMVVITVNGPIDLEMTKGVFPPSAPIGSDVIFSLGLTNLGPMTASGVLVRDLLPSGLNYVHDDGLGMYDPVSGVWNVDTLLVGSTVTLKIIATVTDFDGAKNITQVHAANEPDIDSRPNNDDGDQSEDDEASAQPAETNVLIGDFVWEDVNKNGVQDLGEPGIEGVTIILFESDGTPVDTTTTDVAGNYSFSSGIPAGAYYLSFDVSSNTAGITNYQGTIPYIGPDSQDSDMAPLSSRSPLFYFNPATGDRLELDAGFFRNCPPLTDCGKVTVNQP